MELKIVMSDFQNVTKYADYSTFHVTDETSGYRLTVGGYSGTAGTCNKEIKKKKKKEKKKKKKKHHMTFPTKLYVNFRQHVFYTETMKLYFV